MYQLNDMPAQVAPELLEQLTQCETATIGHFHTHGFVEPAIASMLPEVRIAGTAVTVSLPPEDGTLLNHLMRLVRPGDVLIVHRQGDRHRACWGGVMTEVASRLGVAGVVIDGMATDAVTIRDKQFPVWSRGVASLTTRLAGIGGALNVPVSIGGVTVNPGDAILADESGVLVMASSEVTTLATHAIEVQQKEEELLAKIAEGACLPDLTGSSQLIKKINGRETTIGSEGG